MLRCILHCYLLNQKFCTAFSNSQIENSHELNFIECHICAKKLKNNFYGKFSCVRKLSTRTLRCFLVVNVRCVRKQCKKATLCLWPLNETGIPTQSSLIPTLLHGHPFNDHRKNYLRQIGPFSKMLQLRPIFVEVKICIVSNNSLKEIKRSHSLILILCVKNY